MNDIREQQALEEANRKVAAIYLQKPRDVTFMFVPLIDQRRVLRDGQIVVARETLGDCNTRTGLIRIIRREGWQNTAIHELVHLYNPDRRERWVGKATTDVIKYLKQLART